MYFRVGDNYLMCAGKRERELMRSSVQKFLFEISCIIIVSERFLTHKIVHLAWWLSQPNEKHADCSEKRLTIYSWDRRRSICVCECVFNDVMATQPCPMSIDRMDCDGFDCAEETRIQFLYTFLFIRFHCQCQHICLRCKRGGFCAVRFDAIC